ncbi:amidase [Sulfitobacter mediterraneus]|uniref:amidase n=1 Tax=Sulfitobacter mediterraneus TaxID=83219 RepID=UPI001932DF18|nr:amidase [Sulfitobacter mediterraneus]MBM1631871.1 amidase [Sulfitobacter mediterraneus]MBM1639686.1 amidase [Sulfitobacter mediterraneus]MBM1643735.1 amidase [Sulfitobacter mediterraneus]MBM1647781.1 amidase [Sulfitobacter mediterraneus]MBM1651826.1 amidase [Sulfitobacter mediterraneus]
MDILELGALELSSALERRDVSAREVMQATLDRIAAVNGTVNAIVSLRDSDQLLAEAEAADAAPRGGWMHGMPIAIKDLANAAGFPTSQGSPIFAGQMAVQDDLPVARIRAAGAIVIGKTNTPEFGLGSHTYNPVHGATTNPYDPARSSGGSSGGAAAALATRTLAVADGSDMMGSLRNPAGWNNVYGMRPGWGSVPGEPAGDVFLHQLATAGPMARSPADLAALLDTMAGADPRLPLSQDQAATLPQMAEALPPQRIAWLGDWDGALPFEDGLLDLSAEAVAQLGNLGHEITPLAAPFNANAIWDSWITLRSFAVAGGARALHENPDTRAMLKPAAIWEIERGMGLSAMQVQQASELRSDWFRAAVALFDSFDVLVLPSAQIWPFDVTLDYPREIAGITMDTYHRWMQVVIPASLLGLPVVNIPAGFGQNGLPAGLQLIGPRGSDARLLQLAQQWHEATRWPQQRPPAI